MEILLGGVRGTATVTDAAYRQFGGDTTAFLIKGAEGEQVLIDFGSGLRGLHRFLHDPTQNRLALVTHYHLDHLNGFPVLPLIYDPEASLDIFGPPSGGLEVESVFSDMMARPFWPLQIHMLEARLSFTTLRACPAKGHPFGSLVIRWCPVHHPCGCMAYRIDEPATGESVVVATDIEWQASDSAEKAAFLRFCTIPTPVKLLLFDGHFTPEQISHKKGWGHSTWAEGVDIVQRTGIEKLLITHHAPEHDDRMLADIETTLQQHLPDAALARQLNY